MKIEPKSLDEIINLNPPSREVEEIIYPNEDEEEILDTEFSEEEE